MDYDILEIKQKPAKKGRYTDHRDGAEYYALKINKEQFYKYYDEIMRERKKDEKVTIKLIYSTTPAFLAAI